jgi:hypothetical protein
LVLGEIEELAAIGPPSRLRAAVLSRTGTRSAELAEAKKKGFEAKEA